MVRGEVQKQTSPAATLNESSLPENLNNSEYDGLDVEAECSVFSKYSDMNRVVSSILKSKQSEAEVSGFSKKRRQRLTVD